MKSIFSKLILVTLALAVAFSAQNPVSAATNTAYKNAENLGEGLLQLKAEMEESIDYEDIIFLDLFYDRFTKEIANTERAIGKVPGAKNRKALLDKYIGPSKRVKERVIYEVSQVRLLYIILDYQLANKMSQAESAQKKLGRLKKRAVEIKKAGGYQALPQGINNTLAELENKVTEGYNPENRGDFFFLYAVNLFEIIHSKNPYYFELGASDEAGYDFWLGYQSPSYGDELLVGSITKGTGTQGEFAYDPLWDDEEGLTKTGEYVINNGVLTFSFADKSGEIEAIDFPLSFVEQKNILLHYIDTF